MVENAPVADAVHRAIACAVIVARNVSESEVRLREVSTRVDGREPESGFFLTSVCR